MARGAPPSDRFLRGKAAAQAAAARARALAELDRTVDELTPVEHLIDQMASVSDRMANVETTIDLPNWEEFKSMRAEVAHCRADRLKRERRAKWIAGAALTVAGSFVTGAVMIVRSINESSNASAVAADRFDTMRVTVDGHSAQLKTIGEVVAGHSATIDLLKRTTP